MIFLCLFYPFYVIIVAVFQFGHSAVSISVAEQYIEAFGNLAKEGNTVLLPSNTGDISNMVSQVRRCLILDFLSFTFIYNLYKSFKKRTGQS